MGPKLVFVHHVLGIGGAELHQLFTTEVLTPGLEDAIQC